MTLTPRGINWCLQSFGDTNYCAVSTGYGLTFSYTDTQGQSYNGVAGSTAAIVNFLATGIVTTLAMDQFPERGTFTKQLMEAENGASVGFGDGDIFAAHDENSGDQWCFIPCSAHTDQTTCEDVYQCYWWNQACHVAAPTCTELNNQLDCLKHECYWWNQACHDVAPSCEELLNEPDCTQYGCFWYNNSCHSADQPKICYWIDNQGGPIGITSLNIFELITSYSENIVIPGYDFIPTSLETYGAILYYMNDIPQGNANTGCAYS